MVLHTLKPQYMRRFYFTNKINKFILKHISIQKYFYSLYEIRSYFVSASLLLLINYCPAVLLSNNIKTSLTYQMIGIVLSDVLID